MTKQKAINYIETYVAKQSSATFGWYVGITNDAKRRLGEHKAKDAPWVYAITDSESIARKVEEYFLEKGFRGGTGGGGEDATIVYAYKITASTDEDA